ncbi:MAG TPA: sulfotransferase [Oscillatoriales cyanobacterium M59_W2019_021]|nr:sulfotransferase [Oscillatoriales cyanobacterium M4454_W2019_049]HIK51324.1 sulfotransferase [Oscillatoriales cyanobacterium M59_W2019_021]
MVLATPQSISHQIDRQQASIDDRPCFICASGRSGSTHLRLMLDCHPQIACSEEIDFMTHLISNTGEFPQLDRYYQWLETNRIFQGRNLRIDRTLSYPELVNSFLEQKRDRKPILCAVSHFHFDRLLQLWPQARFIHMVRDGRDVAYSCIREKGWSGNPWLATERWMEAERLWDKIRDRIPNERKLEITYEELVCQPVQTLDRICQFLGVSYHPAMMTYHQTSTYGLPDPRYVGLWQHQFNKRQIQLAEARISEMLVARGYTLSGLRRLKVDAKMQLQLKIQDRLSRIRIRIQRYGLPLMVLDWLSRRLPLPNFQKRVKFRMNRIDVSLLK